MQKLLYLNIFPESKLPKPISGRTEVLVGVEIHIEEFKKLTKIPIVLYFGDNRSKEVTDKLRAENWRTRSFL
ncbi:MAG: hypothetical protein LBD84_03840 [Campylobacteraceae bacterium]|nr:hypothetical protein [Campylobacteraceae bacterium]